MTTPLSLPVAVAKPTPQPAHHAAPQATPRPAQPAAQKPAPQAKSASAATTTAAYNPLADRELRMALNGRGIRTVAQVQAFVAETCPSGVVSREELMMAALSPAQQANEPDMTFEVADADDTQQYIPDGLDDLPVETRGN